MNTLFVSLLLCFLSGCGVSPWILCGASAQQSAWSWDWGEGSPGQHQEGLSCCSLSWYVNEQLTGSDVVACGLVDHHKLLEQAAVFITIHYSAGHHLPACLPS
jgi:hypothetical protein